MLFLFNQNIRMPENYRAFAQIVEKPTTVRVEKPNEYETDRARIRKLTANRDYENLISFLANIRSKWRNNPKILSLLLSEISHAFSSYDFQNKLQYAQAVKLAKEILVMKEGVPISIKYEMVRKLRSRSSYIVADDQARGWARDRTERMEMILQFWRYVESNIDRTFDLNNPKNRPVGNVEVAGRYFPGVSPEAIKEPEIRREYEKKLAANNLLAEKFNRQFELRKIDESLSDFIEQVIIDFYSIEPKRTSELKHYILIFRLSKESRDRISKAISINNNDP